MSSFGYDNEGEPSAEEMEKMMVQKAFELFVLCDKEEKGFITKRDMQRLQTELPLSPDQLESVFDSLDNDGNGFLTLQEFTDGFGGFLGLKNTSANDCQNSEKVFEDEDDDTAEEERLFTEMMQHTGAQFSGGEEATVKSLWSRLRKDDPDLLNHFEEFINKVATDVRKSKMDCETLESVLKSKSTAHDEEVRKLYEEMEYQIKSEKEQILSEEKAKERQLREAMEKDLMEKDRILQDLLQKHQELESRLHKVNMTEAETKQENERLMKEKEELEDMLLNSQDNLDESKSYISQLTEQQRNEKRDRARAALQLSEGIALERESLVKQLDMLRDVNKRLRDDKDEADIRRDLMLSPGSNLFDEMKFGQGKNDQVTKPLMEESKSMAERRWPPKKELAKQGSILSDYFPPSRSAGQSTRGSYSESVNENSIDIEDDGIEYDDDSMLSDASSNYNVNHTNYVNGDANSYNQVHNRYSHGHTLHNKMMKMDVVRDMDVTSSESEAHAMTHDRRFRKHRRHNRRLSKSTESLPDGSTMRTSKGTTRTLSTSHTDLSTGTGTVHDSETESRLCGESPGPQRVFKIVFVGDSGVGKSSFIHRFCSNHFKASFSATIGVDFQVKSVTVDGHVVALQLWDTAGQERFRSITKQYFRKADGVLIMYDVTSESTFTNVRNWMNSVQQGVDEGTVLVLVGNKTDLSDEDIHRAVKLKDGAHLADEYGALFFESSAKSGLNVVETIHALARLLKDKEDKDIEKALNLEEESVQKKGGCCS